MNGRERVTLPVNIEQLDSVELVRRKDEIDGEVDKIKNQLDEAKARKAAGEAVDRMWFAKATAARRILGRMSQRLQAELSRRRGVRREGQRTFESMFVVVAKRRLDACVFAEMVEEANAEVEVVAP